MTTTTVAGVGARRAGRAGRWGLALLLALVSWTLLPGPAVAQETEAPAGGDFVEGEVVVKLQPSATLDQVYEQYPEVDASGTETFLESSKIYLLRLVPGADTAGVRDGMSGNSNLFLYAEPNYTVDPPEGTRRARSWGDGLPEATGDATLYTDQYAVGAMRLLCARPLGTGAGTTVAVLDTGVVADHPALEESLVAGYDFVDDDADPSEGANGLDDDGDGSVDEMVGHGTHVAGIVRLTAPQASIMPLRVLDSDGTGNTFVIAEAIRRAVDPDGDPNTPDGADVINMSLGTQQPSRLIRDVTEDLGVEDDDDDDDDDDGPALDPVSVPVEGVVVVAAAGNEGESTETYPAAEAGVLAVSSVGADEGRSEFSNYGGWIDVAAPGDDVYSAFAPDARGNPRYAQWDGTSMAAPFVAGQAALIRGLEPQLPASMVPGESSPVPPDKRSVESVVEESARPLDSSLGAGHADAFAALEQLSPGSGASCEAPQISGVRPAVGTSVRDRTPTIRATVTDLETNLSDDDMELTLDGQPVRTFRYVAGSLTYEGAQPLSLGQHAVELSVRDADGLRTTETWRFKVVKRSLAQRR